MLLLSLLVAPSALAAEPTRYALVVGVSHYQSDPAIDLRFADNDAKAVAAALIDTGAYAPANVVVMTSDGPPALQPTRSNILTQVSWLAQREPGASLLFYFSGHGTATGEGTDRRNLLLVQDTSLADAGTVQQTAVVFDDQVLASLLEAPAASRLLVLDACRSNLPAMQKGLGAFAPSGTPSTKAVQLLETPPASSSATRDYQVIFSSEDGRPSFEDAEAEMGRMTRYLVQGLAGDADARPYGNGNQSLSTTELFGLVKAQLYEAGASGERQLPALRGDYTEEWAVPLRTVSPPPLACPARPHLVRRAAADGLDEASDPLALRARWDVLMDRLTCTEGLMGVAGAASLHQLTTLYHLQRRDVSTATEAARAYLDLTGDPLTTGIAAPPASLPPLEVAAKGLLPSGTAPLPDANGERWRVDGRPASERPIDRPALVQQVDLRGRPLPDAHPQYLMPGEVEDPKVVPVASRGLRPLPLALGGGALATGVASGVLYWVATRQDGQLNEVVNGLSAPVPVDSAEAQAEIDRLRRTSVGLAWGSRGAGLVAVGLGATAVVLW